MDPSGKFAYVANEEGNNISGDTIDPKTGALTSIAGSPFAGEKAPFSAAAEPSGKFAYVADTDGDVVSGYTINPATGALTAVSGSLFATGPAPISLAFSRGVPALHAVYITNEGSKSVLVINPQLNSSKRYQETIVPRMNILNTVESEAFESTPVFNSVQRKTVF